MHRGESRFTEVTFTPATMVYSAMLAEWIASEQTDEDDARLQRGVDELFEAASSPERTALVMMVATEH